MTLTFFVKFERLEDGHRNYSMTGFGLGLYITKLIVKDHQGEIRASSPGLGKGSTFSLELSLTTPTKAKEFAVATPALEANSATPQATNGR